MMARGMLVFELLSTLTLVVPELVLDYWDVVDQDGMLIRILSLVNTLAYMAHEVQLKAI